MLPFGAAFFEVSIDMANPLLEAGQAGSLPDFPAIEPGHVNPALEELLEQYQQGMESALDTGRAVDWQWVEAEIEWSDQLSKAWAPVSHLNSVADSSELRDAYNAGLESLTRHSNWRQQHAGIFRAYKSLKDSDGFRDLAPEQQRIVELELRDFHLAGVDLPEDKKKEYREIVLQLSKLRSRFSENLLDATQAWTLNFEAPEALAGLPEAEMRLLAGLAQSHELAGWLVDLSAPAFHAVMTYAGDRNLRKEVYTAYVTRASEQGPNAGEWDNAPVIAEILALRHQLAELLGFDNYVDYALASRMAESPASVLAFLEELAHKAYPAALRQFAQLEAFAQRNGAGLPLEAWDVAYWSEKFRQHSLHLSDEELKPYFPLEQMLQALRGTAHSLFGIRFEQDPNVNTWHEDVRYYWLTDAGGNRFAGLYMDLFARRNKRGGAWMDTCQSRRLADGGVQVPVAFLTCNLAPPVEDQPCLMTHNDVQTLFHEFGHCLHHLVTVIDWPQVNGINNVEWDAVELPSQLLENWCWEEELLLKYARHYRTGEAIPGELMQRLMRSRYFQKALFLVRQLEYGICDLRLHLDYDPDNPADPLDVLAGVRKQVAVVPVPDFNRFLNGFGHIFGGGYAAGYYSYLWAEQLAADAWGRFRSEGAFNSDAGEDLRREILAVGASRPALESFIAFRGRPPESGPLLESYGLTEGD